MIILYSEHVYLLGFKKYIFFYGISFQPLSPHSEATVSYLPVLDDEPRVFSNDENSTWLWGIESVSVALKSSQKQKGTSCGANLACRAQTADKWMSIARATRMASSEDDYELISAREHPPVRDSTDKHSSVNRLCRHIKSIKLDKTKQITAIKKKRDFLPPAALTSLG